MSYSLADALHAAYRDGEALAKRHHDGKEKATYEQVKEMAEKRAWRDLSSVRPAVMRVADEVPDYVKTFLSGYKEMALFLKNQMTLFPPNSHKETPYAQRGPAER